MTHINSFRDLLVWQKAMDLAVRCYGVSRRMPKDEHQVEILILRTFGVGIAAHPRRSLPERLPVGNLRHVEHDAMRAIDSRDP